MEIQTQFVKTNGIVSAATLLTIWFMIIAAIVISLHYKNLAIYLFAVLIIGTAQRYLEELCHQATHRNLFNNIKLNDKLDLFYAIPLFYTIKDTRAEHYSHHFKLKEQQEKVNYFYDHLGISGRLLKYSWYRFFILFLQPFLGFQSFIELKNIVLNTKKYFLNCYIYHFLVLLILWYFNLASVYLYYWLIPYFTVFCVFYYYSEMFTHFGCRNENLSRDTHNWFVNLFMAPLGFCKYHSLHHLAPKVPFFRYAKIEKDYHTNKKSLAQTFWVMFRLES